MITEVQPESRKRMAAGQFLQGVSMVEGMQL
jgi:methionyl-tRNA formyltransferase